MTEQEFLKSKVYQLLCQVDTKLWVPYSLMSSEEKAAFPAHKTAEGYIRDIPFKEAFGAQWHNWNEASRKAFADLENFDAAIFLEITGIKINTPQ